MTEDSFLHYESKGNEELGRNLCTFYRVYCDSGKVEQLKGHPQLLLENHEYESYIGKSSDRFWFVCRLERTQGNYYNRPMSIMSYNIETKEMTVELADISVPIVAMYGESSVFSNSDVGWIKGVFLDEDGYWKTWFSYSPSQGREYYLATLNLMTMEVVTVSENRGSAYSSHQVIALNKDWVLDYYGSYFKKETPNLQEGYTPRIQDWQLSSINEDLIFIYEGPKPPET